MERYVLVSWTTGGYFYDIGSTIAIISILIFVNVLPAFSRKISLILFLVYFITYSYMALFIINFYQKNDHYSPLISHGVGLLPFTISMGLFMNVMINGKKTLDANTGIITSLIIYVIYFLVVGYVLNIMNPFLWQHMVYLSILLPIVWVWNTILEVMITKRNDFYLESDTILGFVHIQTDIFGKFWYDYFVKEKWDEGVIDVDEENRKS